MYIGGGESLRRKGRRKENVLGRGQSPQSSRVDSQVRGNWVQMAPDTELIYSTNLIWWHWAPREKLAGLGHCGLIVQITLSRWTVNLWDPLAVPEWCPVASEKFMPGSSCLPPVPESGGQAWGKWVRCHKEHRLGVKTPEALMSALFLAPVWTCVSKRSLQIADKHTSTKPSFVQSDHCLGDYYIVDITKYLIWKNTCLPSWDSR